MLVKKKFEVSDHYNGLRLDVWLGSLSELGSRSRALNIIRAGKVTNLCGGPVKASQEVLSGQVFEVEIEKTESVSLVPYDFPLDIVYEDEDLIVVNKPAGLVVHPACGHLNDTLVNALINRGVQLSMGSHPVRPGLVHRLDKGTSGLLVVAKTEQAQASLYRQFKEKSIHRLYRAIVFGRLRSESGHIESYLRRHPDNRFKVSSVTKGQESLGKRAVTHFRMLSFHSSGLSLVELKLETGRTHQIRCHLSELNHPIVGDDLYGGKVRAKNLKSKKLSQWIRQTERFALHAFELGFSHPRDNQRVCLFKSDWPQDLSYLVDYCQFPNYS